MIAYNLEWLGNLLVRQEAALAAENNCISKSEKGQVDAAYPVGFYTPNMFVRVGLFVLTVIIVAFSVGFVSLFFLEHLDAIGAFFIFFGILIYVALELMVRKRHFKSGVDDALMWMAAGNIIGGLNGLTNVSMQANAIIIFLMAVFLFLRFTNAVMACIACLSLLAIIFFTLLKMGVIGKAITPFVIMAVAGLIYGWVQSQLKARRYKYYTGGMRIVTVTALVCVYAAGNYFMVREASIAMLGMNLQEGESIPFGWLFWIFTVAIPIIYIVRGVQNKDAVMLRTGLLLVAAVVFTVRYYYHVMPVEIAMLLAGMLFIAVAYGLMKYLETPKYGFTHKAQNDGFFMDKLQVESLLIAETFSGPAGPADGGTQFGGGSGGGGGASGQF